MFAHLLLTWSVFKMLLLLLIHSFIHTAETQHTHTGMYRYVCVCHTFKKLTATMTPTLKAPFTVIQIPLQQVVVVVVVIVVSLPPCSFNCFLSL